MPQEHAEFDIPGLDIAKAKRYSRTKLALLVGSVAWSAAQMLWPICSGTPIYSVASVFLPRRSLGSSLSLSRPLLRRTAGRPPSSRIS
jgi:hypothetical protein